MSFTEAEESAFADQARRDNVEVFSPTPKKPITLDFFDALKEVAFKQKRVTKLEWNSGEFLELRLLSEADMKLMGGTTQASLVMIYREHDKAFHPYVISDGDLAGTDWVVLP